ncbi:MAG TPA: RyR domain-containing protein [Caulobacteraceae bacterium]
MATDQARSSGLLRPWMFGVWLVLVVVTFVLAYWGWHHRPSAFNFSGFRAHENAAFMALRAFASDDFYISPGQAGSDWRLIVARWTGLAAVAGTLAAAGMALFQAQIAGFWAALQKGHTLVVGDHEMAQALVAEAVRLRLATVHISAAAARPEQTRSLITLPRGPGQDPLVSGRADRARRVIVAETDLGASAEHALRAVEQMKSWPATRTRVAVHLDDPATAERIHHAPGGIDLFAFSEAQASARAVMLRYPPFLLARRLGASAAHILIVGFGGLGQALARDLVLNSLVADLGEPHITVIDHRAGFASSEFLHRHPEFKQTSQFSVFSDLDEAGLADVAGDGRPPVCAAYVCPRASAGALSSAIALCERATRHELVQGPIFLRLRSGALSRPEGGVANLQARKLYSFGGLSAAAASSHALDDDPDAAARAVHQAYTRIAGFAADPWESLSEEMRISNRRVVSHVPAKLASLGFDLEPWLAMPDEARPWPPALAPDEPLYRGEADRRLIAVLEHRRWTADRRVNGWRYGPTRDNSRKIHPDIVPFDELPKEVQTFDFGVAEWMDAYLPRRPGGLTRSAG